MNVLTGEKGTELVLFLRWRWPIGELTALCDDKGRH